MTWPGERLRGGAVSADAKVVRAVAWLRVVVVSAVAATGSIVANDLDTLYLTLGLLWLPWATVVLLASDRSDSRVALLGGPLGDVAALCAVQVLAPEASRAVLFGYLITVAFTAFTAGRTWAAGVAVLTFALVALANAGAPVNHELLVSDLLPFAFAMVGLLLLARRSVSVHALASARAEGLRTKADVILATVVGGVVVTDAAGGLLQANPSAQRILGTADLIGRPCHEALGLHSGVRAFDCRGGCQLLQHDAAQGAEVWRINEAGEKQPILASAVTLSTSDGVEVVHSLQDITRLKQAEEAKTLFLATASHELKTPLTVINGFAETLTKYDDLDPATQAMALAAIRTRAKELTRVVDRLLLSSRIEAGKVSIVTKPFDVTPLLHERVVGLAQATQRDLTCTADALPLVTGETDAFVTVVDHLLENALKYSPDGGPVLVTAEVSGDCVNVSIKDSGIGMDAEQAARCFEKFWQAESTDVRRFGGTGIGLYIVHSLVDAMGGRIVVTSVPGQGTTFTLVLRTWKDQPAPREAGQGESTSIQEFMRQIGVPSGGQR